ncbi:hypothetical protein BRC21_02340 [Candidatus Saccharibacteria bacterium SW_7_54_9]|nr:MAG: hypothetical protein BRC21_02340 [Candidatus Saccharibacteria bacterium SW_7_54_9]
MKLIKRLYEETSWKVVTAGLYVAAVLSPAAAFAQLRGPFEDQRTQPEGTPEKLLGSDGVFETVANILLLVTGAVAVIMLIIGGFRYVVSGGDSNAVQGAKDTILYAIIGIVVAFLAFAAINFVTEQLTEQSGV